MNLKNYAENHGMKIITIFVLIDLRREIKEDFEYVMKAKKNVYRSNTSDEGFLKTITFSFFLMICSIKDREDLQNLEELVSLESQVKAVRLQDKLGKQNIHEDMKKAFEPVTTSLENTSQDITKTITETSVINNKALENLNNKLLDKMNDRGIVASYLMSLLSKITNPENSGQFKLLKDANSNRVKDLLLHNSIPISLHGNLLTFRDAGRVFELKLDLLEMITNKKYNVDLACLVDKKLLYKFAKEMNFDLKAVGKKSTRDRTLIKLVKSPGLMVSAWGVSKTIFLIPDPDELCNRLNLLVQEKQAGNNSDLFNQQVFAIVDKLLEYKCISKKQHKQIFLYVIYYIYSKMNKISTHLIVCIPYKNKKNTHINVHSIKFNYTYNCIIFVKV